MAFNHEWHSYNDEIIKLWEKHSGEIQKKEIARKILGASASERDLDNFRHHIRRVIEETYQDKEIVAENVRLAKGKQKQQDLNRIERKSFREHARVENAIEAIAEEIRNQNKQFAKELSKLNLKLPKRPKGGVGIIQITDTHFNELINTPTNKYDFQIAAKRLKKHVSESLAYFEFKGVERVLMAFTGDLLNSDRRLDEKIAASTNRAKATVLSIHLLKQAILDVRMRYPVTIIGVLGNESRVDQEMMFSDDGLSNNYDFTIMAQLHQMFEFAKIKDVTFAGYSNTEEVVKIEKQQWLLAHNLSRFLDTQDKTQAAIGRYALAGKRIDFTIGGHIHATRVTDWSARSASMAGSNSYNEIALNLIGRASQLCFTVKGNERSTQVNDLQNVDEIEGYEIVKYLEAYNAKSLSKTYQPRTILQITI